MSNMNKNVVLSKYVNAIKMKGATTLDASNYAVQLINWINKTISENAVPSAPPPAPPPAIGDIDSIVKAVIDKINEVGLRNEVALRINI